MMNGGGGQPMYVYYNPNEPMLHADGPWPTEFSARSHRSLSNGSRNGHHMHAVRVRVFLLRFLCSCIVPLPRWKAQQIFQDVDVG